MVNLNIGIKHFRIFDACYQGQAIHTAMAAMKYREGKKSVKTLKNYKTRKIKQNKKSFADLASISHGIFFKIRKKKIIRKIVDRWR